MSNESSLLGWVLAGVAAIVGSLTSALAWMYKKQISDYEKNEAILRAEAQKERDEAIKEKARLELKIEKMEEKVNACEAEHNAAKIELAKINERLRLLEQKGCLSGNCHLEPKK